MLAELCLSMCVFVEFVLGYIGIRLFVFVCIYRMQPHLTALQLSRPQSPSPQPTAPPLQCQRAPRRGQCRVVERLRRSPADPPVGQAEAVVLTSHRHQQLARAPAIPVTGAGTPLAAAAGPTQGTHRAVVCSTALYHTGCICGLDGPVVSGVGGRGCACWCVSVCVPLYLRLRLWLAEHTVVVGRGDGDVRSVQISSVRFRAGQGRAG